MAQSFIEIFKSARRVGVPLITINTGDPAATMGEILKAYSEAKEIPPIMCHDIVRGISSINDEGEKAIATILQASKIEEPVGLSNPVEMLVQAVHAPRRSILFMLNADRFIDQPPFVQALWNLRDTFKANRRTVVMLCPDITLPAALAHDVLVINEPLPDRDQLAPIIELAHKDTKLPLPKKEVLAKACDALVGLTAFDAEQVAFMSCKPGEGMVVEELWERKRQQIERAVGAKVWRGNEKFSDIVGNSNVVNFVKRLLKGKREIGLVLFLDEIEKMFAGLQGDLSGVSQKMFGRFLTWMQDRNVIGILLLGPPGTGKSLLAKAIGNEGAVPTIAGDIAGMEASLVGDSSKNLEQFLKMVDAVAGGKTILVLATCNNVDSLPPELRRRFKRGTFFMDLMSKDERTATWNFYLKKFGIKDRDIPDDDGWTGAEIEQCCDMADSMGMSLMEASGFVVPVAESAKEQIEKLRHFAAGRFISASYPGKYKLPTKKASAGGREVN